MAAVTINSRLKSTAWDSRAMPALGLDGTHERIRNPTKKINAADENQSSWPSAAR